MIVLADITDRDVRDLIRYSLHHFMIKQRITSGLLFRHIADMFGTSVAQIEKTYYHLNDEIRLTNAVAEYRPEKMAKPETKTVTLIVAVPKTKIVKQQTPPQTIPKDIERTDFTPIRPQPSLPNQPKDRDKR